MKNKLNLSQQKIDLAKYLAQEITSPVQEFISSHTTDTVERAALRILGADGVNDDGYPVPNLIVDSLRDRLHLGVCRYYVNAKLSKDLVIPELNIAIADGLDLREIELVDEEKIKIETDRLLSIFSKRVVSNKKYRNLKISEFAENENSPMLYLIIATGNIHEDVKQAVAAAEQGADIIAVIRTTAQSLLDYVPFGENDDGFCGTYATQDNFRIMREALDEVSEKTEHYVRLVNYCSGLCMPEIAVMGAYERLDMMLNDSMYGILFRDINMYRTFVDQHFSRMINSFADIVINTGEDNYLTTTDAYDKAYTVLASQLINAKFAENAGLPHGLTGLGHAFEMDPKLKNGFLYELAQAQMAKEIFPDYPLKYMPPTKFMNGNIFRSYAINTMFNFTSKATGQSIHLLGILTEAIHTPHLQDRFLSIENAKYVMNNMADFYDEIEFKNNGIIVNRANEVLDQAIRFLEEVKDAGLFSSIELGLFADMKRQQEGGKGIGGVTPKSGDYWNPVEDFLKKEVLS